MTPGGRTKSRDLTHFYRHHLEPGRENFDLTLFSPLECLGANVTLSEIYVDLVDLSVA